MIEKYKDYQDVRGELRAMGVSLNVIEYVEHSMKLAYAIGARDGLKEGRSISIVRDQSRLMAAFGDC